MKRALFLISLAAATAVTLTSFRGVRLRNRRMCDGNVAGSCADRRRKSRWAAYTAADFT